uniref:Zinc finger protein-like 1 homolog n=1 Tax=Lynceus sp. MCZ IZ 141354 TaxID=1930659 RepID=A0A9N6ZFZ3_9CRUS|nr:EOG090X0ASS [Lynceus sp. MCZ IZ 141354]
MGLCKCPRKKVTNQFCYEHRINVCEYCMVKDIHRKCVVQSYLLWLRDSDYDPSCTLCSLPLKSSDASDCVRLTCYHVFHVSCLDKYARSLPPHTAPAGYVCPTCGMALFPPTHLVSPVADVLKKTLRSKPWAREGLGLPLFDGPEAEELETLSLQNGSAESFSSDTYETEPLIGSGGANEEHYSVVNVEGSGTVHRSDNGIVSPKKLSGPDYDEDKYKRRSAWDALKLLFLFLYLCTIYIDYNCNTQLSWYVNVQAHGKNVETDFLSMGSQGKTNTRITACYDDCFAFAIYPQAFP